MVKKTKTGYLLTNEEYQKYMMFKDGIKAIKQPLNTLNKIKGQKT